MEICPDLISSRGARELAEARENVGARAVEAKDAARAGRRRHGARQRPQIPAVQEQHILVTGLDRHPVAGGP